MILFQCWIITIVPCFGFDHQSGIRSLTHCHPCLPRYEVQDELLHVQGCQKSLMDEMCIFIKGLEIALYGFSSARLQSYKYRVFGMKKITIFVYCSQRPISLLQNTTSFCIINSSLLPEAVMKYWHIIRIVSFSILRLGTGHNYALSWLW